MKRLVMFCACCTALALHGGPAVAAGAGKKATPKAAAKAAPKAAAPKAAAPKATPKPAAPKNSYEALQAQSVSVYDARAILLPFVKTCEREKTSFRKLFCEALNERLKSQHQSKRYEQTFEPTETGKSPGPLVLSYNKISRKNKEPSFDVTFRGCVTCDKPMLNRKGGDIAKARFFVFKQPKKIRVRRGGRFELSEIDVTKVNVPIKVDELDEQPWPLERGMREVGQFIRLDVIYRPVAGVTKIGGRFKYGVINFELAGYRLYNKCSGEVYKAEPPMAATKYKVDKNDLSCPQNRPDWGKKRQYLPPKLPKEQVKALMALIEADLRACYDQFGKTGTYPVDILVLGNGRVKEVKVLSKNAGTPTAKCVQRMVKAVRFPEFSGRKLHMPWQFKVDKK